MKATHYKKIAKLVIEAQEGDKEAFAELYSLTSQGVYFYALQLSKNKEAAQDITQEVYLYLMAFIGEVNSPRSFVAWINKRTYFTSLNYLRKENRNYNLEDENVVIDDFIDKDQSSSPLYSYLKKEKQELLMEAIDTLSPNHKSVLLLKYYQGLSIEDIALAMDCPVGTVTSRLSRAKEYLKETLRTKASKGLLGLAILPNIKEVLNKVAIENQLSAAQFAGISSSVGIGGVKVTSAEGKIYTKAVVAFCLGIVAVGFAGVILIVSGMKVPKSPVIASIVVHAPPNYTNENIEVTIEVEDKNAVNEILVVGETGKTFKVFSVEGNTYKSYVTANGTYQVRVINSQGQEDKSSFKVDKIDDNAPIVKRITMVGAEIVLQLSDDKAQIDWDKTTIFKKDSTIVEPTSIDKETNILKINYTNEVLTIIVYDKAGNNSTCIIYDKAGNNSINEKELLI